MVDEKAIRDPLPDRVEAISSTVLAMIQKTPWTWAKTYAKTAPHWYIVRQNYPLLFHHLARMIDRYGTRQEFRNSGNFAKYLRIGEWKYWHYQIILNCTRQQWY